MKSALSVLTFLSLLAHLTQVSAMSLPPEDGIIRVSTQPWVHSIGPRSVTAYVYYPGGSLKKVMGTTGLMLSLHNWGGTGSRGTADPKVLANRYDVVAICVDYLQSGKWEPEASLGPYDFGFLQAVDALRSLHAVWGGLENQGFLFNKGRIYACGGSGGGNVTLMANKLAPRTFACIIDMSGMAKLNEDIAYGLSGGSSLNAGYSRDPASPRSLSPFHQEIRFIGHPEHLEKMKELGNRCKIIISHGSEDKVCPVFDVREMVANMERAGLDVEAHFIEKKDLDGKIFKDTGHSVGDRTKILQHFADRYLLPDSPEAIVRKGKSDFELKDKKVRYLTVGGTYIVSYERGYPEVFFTE